MSRVPGGAVDPMHATAVPDLLDGVLDRLAEGLVSNIRPGIGLRDPAGGHPTPADHYGQTAAALAVLLLRGAGERAWRAPLQAWLGLAPEQIGHAPFNRFLLGLIADGLEADDGLRQGVVAATDRCVLKRSYPSNNWTLLAALCHLLEAGSTSTPARQVDGFVALLDRWTTASGAFIDFPQRPAPSGAATPMAYHHKALFCAAVAAWRTGDPRLLDRAGKMYRWATLTWDGAGCVGGFGRSSHAIYGEACLLASLILAGCADEAAGDGAGVRILRGVLERWSGQFRPDGMLALNPASIGSPSGFDGYMHLSVYNAWAAAVIAWARCSRAQGPLATPLAEAFADVPCRPVAHDVETGLLRCAPGAGMTALVSTRGQPPQMFAADDVELRYAGGVPFHVVQGARHLCPAPARVSLDALLECPALAGWTPVLRIDGRLFGVVAFGDVRIEERADDTRIVLEGQAVALARTAPQGVGARVEAALDWRWFGGALGRREALRRSVAKGVSARLAYVIARDRAALSCEVTIRYEGPGAVTWMNPGGHALVAEALPAACTLIVHGRGDDGSAVDSPAACEGELIQARMDSAIPGAIGRCLPAMELGRGSHGHRLELAWAGP